MRHNQNRRSRGRSRKGPNPLTRSYESNGPDVKVRGTAAHVAEKYMSLARDAQSSGDTVAAENYLQHAEHYNRIVMAAQATQFPQQQPQQFREGQDDYDDDRGYNPRRDRFDSNFGREEEGEEGDGDDDRPRPMQGRPDQPYDNRQQNGEHQSQQGERRDGGQGERMQNERQQHGDRHYGDRQRGPRPDRYAGDQRRDRNDYRDNPNGNNGQRMERNDRADRGDRPEQVDGRDRGEQRFRRPEGPQPEIAPGDVDAPQRIEARNEPPSVEMDEARAQPRRRRGRPRSDAGDTGTEETTPDGAAALAAFPD